MFSFGLVSCFPAFLIKFGSPARVVEWQTRTFEGRMPKGMRVQVPPRAGSFCGLRCRLEAQLPAESDHADGFDPYLM